MSKSNYKAAFYPIKSVFMASSFEFRLRCASLGRCSKSCIQAERDREDPEKTALKRVCAYRTVSMEALFILAHMLPIELLIEERAEVY